MYKYLQGDKLLTGRGRGWGWMWYASWFKIFSRRYVYLCDFLSENLYLLFFLHIIKDIRTSGMFVLELTQLLHYMYMVL